MRTFSRTGKAVVSFLAAALLVASLFAFTGCNYCAHDLEVIEKVASTCVEHGHGYSYKCKKCGKLFAYSLERGLYEISEAEELPLGDHVLTDDLDVRIKDGKTQAESIWDYEIVYKCGLCEETVAVPREHLATIVPPNISVAQTGLSGIKYTGEYGYNDAGTPYTAIKFASATTSSVIELNPTKFAKPTTGKTDPTVTYDEKYEWVYASNIGAYQRFPLYIPFNAGETRHAFFFIGNTTTTTTDPIKVDWSIDGNTWSSVTVAPGEIKALAVDGTLTSNNNLVPMLVKASNPNNSSRLGKVMNIEVTGVFYVGGSVTKLDIDNLPDKVSYAEGETFDPTGLKVYATYSDYCLGKSIRPDECEFSCGDRPLTKSDDRVTVSYGGMKVSFTITVS